VTKRKERGRKKGRAEEESKGREEYEVKGSRREGRRW